MKRALAATLVALFVAAGAFAPFISAAGAKMFGFEDWTELSRPRDLAKIFETQEYTKWRSFRDSEDSRFVNGLAWLARGALLLGEPAKADRYAADVRRRVGQKLLAGTKLADDEDLETALGGAIKVQGSVQGLPARATFGLHVHDRTDCAARR